MTDAKHPAPFGGGLSQEAMMKHDPALKAAYAVGVSYE